MTGYISNNKESGQVAIISVMFFMILFSVITVGFVRTVVSEQRQTTNNELSASALAAAESGLEDAKRIIIYCNNNPSADECKTIYDPNSNDCNTIMSNSNLTNSLKVSTENVNGSTQAVVDSKAKQYYSCLIIHSLTSDYVGKLTAGGSSAIIPLKFANYSSGSKVDASKVGYFTINWHNNSDSGDGQATGLDSSNDFPTVNTWKNSGNRPAVMRAELVSVPKAGFTLDGITDSARAVTLRPSVDNNGGSPYSSGVVDAGVSWTQQTSAGSRIWQSVAMSADGTKLAAMVNNGYIYTSTDSGATWTQQTASGSRNWIDLTMSADGTKLAATVNNGYIYTSTDSGVTWTQRGTLQYWTDIAGSSDGTKLVSEVWPGYIYTSTDSGATWTQRGTSQSWQSVASSADGTKLVASSYGGYIYTSTDSGVTWIQRTASGSRGWFGLTISADGTKLAAVDGGGSVGYIYTSTDSGATWVQRAASGSRQWRSITGSSDGTKLAAVALSGYIYASTDSGATWTQRASQQSWWGIIGSPDGDKLAAVVNNGYIYTSARSGGDFTGITIYNLDYWATSKEPNGANTPMMRIACNDSSSYSCSANLTLSSNLDLTNYDYYLRLQASYNDTYFQVTAKDMDNKPLYFNGVQPSIDVTGRAVDAYKRLMSRVETKSEWSPEYALQSGEPICKKLEVHGDSGTDYCSY